MTVSDVNMNKHPGFAYHKLNTVGQTKIAEIEFFYNRLLGALRSVCPPGRDFSIAITDLESSCYRAKKSVSLEPTNHEVPAGDEVVVTQKPVTYDPCPRCGISRLTGCDHYAAQVDSQKENTP